MSFRTPDHVQQQDILDGLTEALDACRRELAEAREALRRLLTLDSFGVDTSMVGYGQSLDETVSFLLDDARLNTYWGEPLPPYVREDLASGAGGDSEGED